MPPAYRRVAAPEAEAHRWGKTMDLTSTAKSDRILFGIMSACILLVAGPITPVMYVWYPETTFLFKLTKSFACSLCFLLVQYAFVQLVWSVATPIWARRYFEIIKKNAVVPMLALPVCTGILLFIIMQ